MSAPARALEMAPPASLEDLLAPVSAGSPTGEPVRYDPVIDQLKALRRRDDPTLPQGVWKRPLQRADWRGVEELASDILRARSKDLKVAGWLTEAWLFRRGLPGLAHGLALVAGLVERYWDAGLHPRPDDLLGAGDAGEEAPGGEDEGLAVRMAPLLWLDGALPGALREVPLTRPTTEDAEPYTWGDWRHALYLDNLAESQPEAALSEGGVTLADFLAGVGLTSGEFYRDLVDGAGRCIVRLEALAADLERRCGPSAPGFGAVREILTGIAGFGERMVRERVAAGELKAGGEAPEEPPRPDLETVPGGPGAVGEGGGGGAAGSASAGSSPCQITSRIEAYRALEQAADYLLRGEPHSPVPYVVKRAVAWGRLPMAELYRELFEIADPQTIFRLLGLQQVDEEP